MPSFNSTSSNCEHFLKIDSVAQLWKTLVLQEESHTREKQDSCLPNPGIEVRVGGGGEDDKQQASPPSYEGSAQPECHIAEVFHYRRHNRSDWARQIRCIQFPWSNHWLVKFEECERALKLVWEINWPGEKGEGKPPLAPPCPVVGDHGINDLQARRQAWAARTEASLSIPPNHKPLCLSRFSPTLRLTSPCHSSFNFFFKKTEVFELKANFFFTASMGGLADVFHKSTHFNEELFKYH